MFTWGQGSSATPSLVEWKKSFWLPPPAKGNNAFRMLMLAPNKPGCPQGMESTEKMHHPGAWKLNTCILREPVWADQLQCSIMLTHYTTCTQRLRGGQAQGILLTTALLCDMHVLFGVLKMESWIAKVVVISLPFVFSVLLNPDLDCLGWKWS